MAYATISDVYVAARFRTGTNTGDFPDTSTGLLALTNKYLRKIFMALNDNKEDWYSTITLASLSSGVQNYALSSDSSLTLGGGMVALNRLEVTYDGTNWLVATPLQFEQIERDTATIGDIANQFSTQEPFYTIYGNDIYLFPVPTTNVSGGLRKFEVVRQREATGSSLYFGDAVSNASMYFMPKEFMEPLEDFIAADIYERVGKSQEAIATRQQGEQRLEYLRRQFAPRNEDFDQNVTSNAYEDYGE